MKEKIQIIMLQAKDLSIGYRNKKNITCISENINLSLHKGNLVCLLGKNGIGKSTLLRTLTRVQPQLSGDILIGEQQLEAIPSADLAKKMSLVLTERIPENNLTVYELIALGRQPYTNWVGTLTEEDHRYIDLAIQQTNIKDIIYKKHFELSDGQLQKVMIARALSQNTEIITLDEPTAHLDVHNKIEIFTLLKTLSNLDEPTAHLDVHNKIEIFTLLKTLSKELNKTILISTHEIHLALQLADALWLMNEKGIISGDTENLIANESVSKLFTSDLVKFDLKSRQFIIHSY